VRLAAIDPEADAEAFAAWFDDPVSDAAGGVPARVADEPGERAGEARGVGEGVARPINFATRTIADDRLVGGIGLMDINAPRRERAARPVGLPAGRLGPRLRPGDDRLALRYAFTSST
jgi:hypothetical protein